MRMHLHLLKRFEDEVSVAGNKTAKAIAIVCEVGEVCGEVCGGGRGAVARLSMFGRALQKARSNTSYSSAAVEQRQDGALGEKVFFVFDLNDTNVAEWKGWKGCNGGGGDNDILLRLFKHLSRATYPLMSLSAMYERQAYLTEDDRTNILVYAWLLRAFPVLTTPRGPSRLALVTDDGRTCHLVQIYGPEALDEPPAAGRSIVLPLFVTSRSVAVYKGIVECLPGGASSAYKGLCASSSELRQLTARCNMDWSVAQAAEALRCVDVETVISIKASRVKACSDSRIVTRSNRWRRSMVLSGPADDSGEDGSGEALLPITLMGEAARQTYLRGDLLEMREVKLLPPSESSAGCGGLALAFAPPHRVAAAANGATLAGSHGAPGSPGSQGSQTDADASSSPAQTRTTMFGASAAVSVPTPRHIVRLAVGTLCTISRLWCRVENGRLHLIVEGGDTDIVHQGQPPPSPLDAVTSREWRLKGARKVSKRVVAGGEWAVVV